ncbi:MAG: transcriptional repressor LexA [Dehalococcoidales bacterium]|nr:transcriptional repressor LexA [Dehalococcoidales bacterium]
MTPFKIKMKTISGKQQQILEFIRRFLTERDYPPSIRDIQDGCRISSTSVVDYNLKALERQGFIRRQHEISRGIALTSDAASPAAMMMPVPIIGIIAAGTPIPVPAPDTWDITAAAETINVSRDLMRNAEGIYALRVKGESMIDALINDGDIVLMQYTNSVDNGEMAAAWLKTEKEATLKKIYVEPDRIRLQPANRHMQPIFVSPDNLEIQGRVIGVIRKLV